MFEVLPISFHTDAQPSTPLVDCIVDDMLQHIRPCSYQAPFQISNIEYRRTVDSSCMTPRLSTALDSCLDYSVAIVFHMGQTRSTTVSRAWCAYALSSWKFLQGTVRTNKTRFGGRCTRLFQILCGIPMFWQVLAKLDDI